MSWREDKILIIGAQWYERDETISWHESVFPCMEREMGHCSQGSFLYCKSKDHPEPCCCSHSCLLVIKACPSHRGTNDTVISPGAYFHSCACSLSPYLSHHTSVRPIKKWCVAPTRSLFMTTTAAFQQQLSRRHSKYFWSGFIILTRGWLLLWRDYCDDFWFGENENSHLDWTGKSTFGGLMNNNLVSQSVTLRCLSLGENGW